MAREVYGLVVPIYDLFILLSLIRWTDILAPAWGSDGHRRNKWRCSQEDDG